MEQLTAEINKVSTKIDAVEVLLKKPFQNWTEEEREEFGNKKQLRKKEEQLREKEQELLKQQTIILQGQGNLIEI
jgi:hypothetical protein